MFWGGVLVLGQHRGRLGPGARQAAARASSTRAATMQIAHMVHAVATVLMMALFLGHIYIGTIGMTRRLQRDAHRLRRRGLGARAPRALVRRHRGRQDPGAAQRRGRAPAQRWQPAAGTESEERHADPAAICAPCCPRPAPLPAAVAKLPALPTTKPRPRPPRPPPRPPGATRSTPTSCASRRTAWPPATCATRKTAGKDVEAGRRDAAVRRPGPVRLHAAAARSRSRPPARTRRPATADGAAEHQPRHAGAAAEAAPQ